MKPKIILLGLLLLAAVSGCGKNNSSPVNPPLAPSAEVQMTKDGFNPAALTVKLGTQVVFKNTDTKPHWPESDLPGFDSLQGIPPGQSYSYSFTRAGTWTYDDHLNKKFKGTITVTP